MDEVVDKINALLAKVNSGMATNEEIVEANALLDFYSDGGHEA